MTTIIILRDNLPVGAATITETPDKAPQVNLMPGTASAANMRDLDRVATVIQATLEKEGKAQ